jgi:chromosome segregation ATPase
MPEITTAAFVFLALLALLAAVVAIGWLSRVNRHLSELGRRVLASEDVERIADAMQKAVSFESRTAGCENRLDKSQNQLEAHETKLRELAAKLSEDEQVMGRHTTGLAATSDKTASVESRLDSFEHSAGEKLKQLLEYQTKLNEMAAKLESIGQMADRNGAGLAEANRSLETLTDEIQSLRQFRIASEETRRLILEAFSDKRASTSPEQGLAMTPETTKPEENAQASEDPQEESEGRKTFGTYRYP